MIRKNTLPGVRTIDLRHVTITQPTGQAMNRRMAGGVAAIGFHGLILLGLLWSPIGELKTLGMTSPGATWITLAPLDTGVAADFDAREPVLLFDRPVTAEELTVPIVEPSLDIAPIAVSGLMVSETRADKAPVSSPALPALGDFSTSRPGAGGSNDPYAGAALPRRGVMATPAPVADDLPRAAAVQLALRAGVLDALKADLRTRLPAGVAGDITVTHMLDLLVRVSPSGVVEEVRLVNATAPRSDLMPLLQALTGQKLFDVPPGRGQETWQSLSLSI